jgi:hypothetical protein
MRSFMKLVVAAGSQVVVGCHMVGDDSAEIMQVRAGLTSACNVAARGRGGGGPCTSQVLAAHHGSQPALWGMLGVGVRLN